MENLSRNFENLKYHDGFGNHVSSEALEGALPQGQNMPQKLKYGLFSEQLSGTAFTAPRHSNLRSWTYRVRPSCQHPPFKADTHHGKLVKNDYLNDNGVTITPNQFRWKTLPVPTDPTDFVEGLVSVGGAGDPTLKTGLAIYLYAANKSMGNKSFFSSDGDMLIVPWEGDHFITTEFGLFTLKPREIIVIPRGVKFSVDCTSSIRGYISEIFKGHYKLPELGPIGANGLANPRDFQTPVAYYEKNEQNYEIVNKYMGKFFTTTRVGSPYDVVAWHGNYYPFKYNLDLYNAFNTVTYDHPDPSVFTVLTSQTDEPGIAVCDFVIFPPRWIVSERSFRPPYYHRNIMSEYMGNISGAYDAKETGFNPGYGSLHSVMEGHGPDMEAFEKASNAELVPVKNPYQNLSFMFETTYMLKLCTHILDESLVKLDTEYYKCWQQQQQI